MTDVTDPFADASFDDAAVDPFADPDEVGGQRGPFIPWPNVTDIAGRAIALFPKSFDGKAEVSEYMQKKFGAPPVRPEWRCDMLVIDGEVPFSYEYRGKVEGTKDEYADMTYTVETLPFFVPNFRIVHLNIIGTLNKGHDKGALVGRIRPGYTAKEMRDGKTFEDWAREYEAFLSDPRKNKEPRARWHFVLSAKDAPEKAVALDWYRKAYADGYRIEPATIKNAEEKNAK